MRFTKYKIIVPTQEDKEELEMAFRYIHDEAQLDSDNVVMNQLMHEYLTSDVMDGGYNNIIVETGVYDKLKDKRG